MTSRELERLCWLGGLGRPGERRRLCVLDRRSILGGLDR